MYSVSQNYKNKLLSISDLERRIRGTVDGVAFTEADVMAGSFKINQQCVKGADISLGGVFVGQLTLTFLKSFSDRFARNSWRGREITGTIDLKLDNQGNWESVPFGHFFVDDATHGAAGVDIKAYDAMQKFDRAISIDTTSGKLYGFLTIACTTCGVQLGMTKTQVEALPNGDETLGLYPTNDMTTWRDYISWIACTAGGYATINRQGKLEIRTFHDYESPVLSIDIYHRASGGGVSDFVTYYTGINVVNIEDDTVSYYGQEVDTGLTMTIGKNPFLQYGTDQIKERQRRAILNALEDFRYTPFTMSLNGDISLDLGDVIELTGGIAGTASTGCIMAINYVYFGLTACKGYGNNPAMFGAQSKTDKDIAGLSNKTDADKIGTLIYTNAEAYNIGNDQWENIASIAAVVGKDQNIQIHGVAKMNLSEGDTVYLRYRLNNEVQPFIHVMQYPQGYDTLTFFLPVPLTANEITSIDVDVMSHVAGSIGIQDVWMSIQAVGLNEIGWDGLIECEDYINVTLKGKVGVDFEDAVTTAVNEFVTATGEDEYDIDLHGQTVVDFEDECVINMRQNVYRRITEDGIIRVTEDGDKRITEGGT